MVQCNATLPMFGSYPTSLFVTAVPGSVQLYTPYLSLSFVTHRSLFAVWIIFVPLAGHWLILCPSGLLPILGCKIYNFQTKRLAKYMKNIQKSTSMKHYQITHHLNHHHNSKFAARGVKSCYLASENLKIRI